MAARQTTSPEIFDYRALRLSVGVIALLLPLALPAGEGHFSFSAILSSISAYYHGGMRNFFVGSLCAIATFFFAYSGKAPREDAASRFACLFALGVAFFPTADPKLPDSTVGLAGVIHGISAGGLFGVLTLFCLVFFQARFKGRDLTAKEKRRRAIYSVCGWVIVSCIVLIGVTYIPALGAWRKHAKPVFFLESIALVAFAISWFTAGKWGVVSFLVDEPDAFRLRRT